MKKITLFSILAAFVAALSFTSCNTDSDNSYSPLSKEAQKNFQMAMSVGSYNDMVVLFEKKNVANVNNQIDSVASSVGISMTGDSTMSIANFPIAAIAEHISNTELSQAIAKEAPRTITCKYNVMPNSTSEMAYYIACPNVIELNLAYGADKKSHKVHRLAISRIPSILTIAQLPSLFAMHGRRQANKDKQENENSIPREIHLSQDTEYSKRNI